MLKGLDPLLGADLLRALRAMGHGDEIAVVDANFPAHATAHATTTGQLLQLDGVDAPAAVAAILSVLPLDDFVEDAAVRMEVVGAPNEVPAVQREVQRVIDLAEPRPRPLVGLERHAFYARARASFAVLQTGERRFYGCFLLKKGVLAPPG